jgi:anti-anti-sigma factor
VTIAGARRRTALPDACRVTSAVHGDIAAFHIYGEIDHRAAAHVLAVLGAAIGEPAVLVDLSGVSLVDSAGMEAVIGAVGRVHETGACVAISITSPAILATFHGGGLTPAVPVIESSTEALGWLDARRRTRSARDPWAAASGPVRPDAATPSDQAMRS